ncbi:site-specific integrase [Pseudomonas coronafaciens]|uniref:site-specific integrase n=1 Tax=Pseudomonas coronafaciens TaxID=53409 RepID=UPI000EFF6321|nr:site-specific integrase [Pseudomonas coronafaciens]RMP28641.1 hypothetical protein ALQ25_200193 [Pseudomonas coronafaciens pv. atropurpurea]RMV70425.1 hypothetical protein ALP06_03737 [Pseudomonas coronafaciens pv. atropurpurea]
MISNPVFVGLNIGTAGASPGDLNFLPSSWPPEPDFPICISADGSVSARYGDDEWDLTPWAGYVLKLNFGKAKRKDRRYINQQNAQIFKRVVAYWLYGPNPCREVRTLVNQYEIIRQVFSHCSELEIDASNLYRYPKVIESLADSIWPSQANRLTVLLHNIWEHKDHFGLCILDVAGISLLRSNLKKHEKSQTAYIPPRIWLYQLSRLREFLEDFELHMAEIEACVDYCLQAYATSAGDLERACTTQLSSYYRPFASLNNPNKNGKKCGAYRLGPFYKTANKFNILNLLEKWCGDIRQGGVAALSMYFTMAAQVGKAYLLNFTLMRIEEASSLRSDCLVLESDPITKETIYLIKSATTKTVEDDEACWITSPSSQLAISVMSFIGTFRTKCGSLNRNLSLTKEDLANPYLELRAYEPWRRHIRYDTNPEVRSNETHYGSFVRRYPKLFDASELKIRQIDLDAALLVTPSLCPEKFAVGNVWPFSWHQLRRTGAVNMSASGIVGDSSVQYQLKHVSRAMTRYYGQGFYHIDANLNQEARAEYIRGMYETIARSFLALRSSSFISPHGEKRKEQIVEIISAANHSSLVKAAKTGTIVYREILLGACANTSPCPYGGIDYVGRCGGGDGKLACMDLLIDQDKEVQIQRLGKTLSNRLENLPEGSPLYNSTQYQLRAVENALDAIK